MKSFKKQETYPSSVHIKKVVNMSHRRMVNRFIAWGDLLNPFPKAQRFLVKDQVHDIVLHLVIW